LGKGKLGGGLPTEIGNLTLLRVLEVDDANMTGVIPLEYSALTKLTNL
jgi:hypothetical protein